MYILDNDGYQKGDKRFEINENDLPDLIQNYCSNEAQGQNKFVLPNEVNEDNFYNLLVEYHIPQDDSKVIEVDIDVFRKKLDEIEIFESKLQAIFNEN